MSGIRIVSDENVISKEKEIILWLLENGLDFYHFRKPKEDSKAIDGFLETIPFHYRKNIVLHHETKVLGFLSHHKQSEIVTGYTNTHSCSSHSKEEVEKNLKHYEHCFWSPVFDSISKQGYKANENISLDDFSEEDKKRIIALGGIEPSRFKELKAKGFKQIAIKGWFWNQPDYKIAWKEIKSKWQE